MIDSILSLGLAFGATQAFTGSVDMTGGKLEASVRLWRRYGSRDNC